MPLWQRLLITIAAMLIVSIAAGQIWRSLFDFDLPVYLGGVIGGLVALPVWELLKRVVMKP